MNKLFLLELNAPQTISIQFPLFISHLGSLQNSFATKLQNDIKYEKFVTGFSCCLNENKMQRRETRVSLN